MDLTQMRQTTVLIKTTLASSFGLNMVKMYWCLFNQVKNIEYWRKKKKLSVSDPECFPTHVTPKQSVGIIFPNKISLSNALKLHITCKLIIHEHDPYAKF